MSENVAVDPEWIRGLSRSYLELIKSFTSESKRSGFATIEDFVDATRSPTGSIDASRAEYFTFALDELRQQDPRVGDSFLLHILSTFNTNSSVVDIGGGPILLIDVHQSEIVEDMGRLFLAGGRTDLRDALALQLLAEHFIAGGREELGTYFAVRRSILMDGEQASDLPDDLQTEVDRASAVQDVYVLTHEVAHILWSRDQIPKQQFVASATRWIAADAQMMTQRVARFRAEYPNIRAHSLAELLNTDEDSESVASILSQIGPMLQESGYSPDQLRATVERRYDPASGFIEELWADFYAWGSSMQLFSGNWPADQVYRNLTLAMRNLATIDAMRRIAERDTNPQTIDDVSTRRAVLRIALALEFGDLRQNDDYRNALHLRDPSDWDVDMVGISLETEGRYHRDLWQPLCVRGFAEARSIPDEQQLASLYARCQQEFGVNPAEKILREHPITMRNVSQLVQNLQ
jgi:hypothetical protein